MSTDNLMRIQMTPRVLKNISWAKIGATWIVIYLLNWNIAAEASSSLLSTWWSYSGPAGPANWGFLNPDWVMCRSGKFQSPIDIEPRLLLFDPRLRRMRSDIPAKMEGVFRNTGNDLTFDIDDVKKKEANFSGGPLLYGYKAFQIKIHLGSSNRDGSEHKIDGRSFAAEVQVFCYNTNLFKNHKEAWKKPYGIVIFAIMAEVFCDNTNLFKNHKETWKKPYGIVIFAIMAEVGQSKALKLESSVITQIGRDLDDVTNEPFHHLVTLATKIPWQDQSFRIENFDLKSLIPKTKYYVTYEGSLTQPGCYETVTWVIFNKPIVIEAEHLKTLRQLQKDQPDNRMTMMEGNRRPIQALNNRVIRTNINYPYSNGGLCDMKKVTYYEANEYLRRRQETRKRKEKKRP